MENLRKMLFVGMSFLAFSFMAKSAVAQSGSAILIPATQQIVLDESKPLADTYVIDISGIGIQTNQAAQAYFSKYASQAISFQFDLVKKEAYMTLRQGLFSDAILDVRQWNNILNKLNK